jgi:hypothetical protein
MRIERAKIPQYQSEKKDNLIEMGTIEIEYAVLKKMLADERAIGIDLGRILEKNASMEKVDK